MIIKLLIGCLLFFFIIEFDSLFAAGHTKVRRCGKKFEVDYKNDVFLMDGVPFWYVGGSFHYFRCPHQYWRDRLRTMRSAGLNVLTTYVEWSYQEPKYRQYEWTGDKDVIRFIQIAEEEGFYVIFRPGPFICAERDNGGLPYWLLTKYPNIKMRTSDEDYKKEVAIWYDVLMKKIEPYLYGNGGPIIMVQVENEYGSYYACDHDYMAWIANLTESYVKGAALLFTVDGPGTSYLECGATPGVFATIDFGSGFNVTEGWEAVRKVNGGGPVVNTEFYPGWLTHWNEPAATVDTKPIIDTMKDLFDTKASFNFYMFYGGSNFGFTAGANLIPEYVPDLTSYDYDAPMTECGDTTPKFMEIRKAISEYMHVPYIPVPPNRPKAGYGVQTLTPILSLLDGEARDLLGKNVVQNKLPLTFEALDQYSGFVLYETMMSKYRPNPTQLVVEDLRDRGYVYTDQGLIGILSRSQGVNSVPIMKGHGNYLGILVENQGRVNYGLAEDFKGILGHVTVDSLGISNWMMTTFPLECVQSDIQHLIPRLCSNNITKIPDNTAVSGMLKDGPIFYGTTFTLHEEKLYDTYLDMTNWGKGIVWINDVNLGRYWPGTGPQVTLYVPGVYLNKCPEVNTLIILELEEAPDDYSVEFVNTPNLGYGKS